MLLMYTADFADTRSQIHWDDVEQWANAVLGDNCKIVYHNTIIEDGVVKALWDFTGVDGIGDLVVRVQVETRFNADGDLDYEQSSRVAFDDHIFKLTDVNLYLGPNYEILDTLWTAAPFDDYARYSIQHAAHIPRGEVRIVCGNTFLAISGGASSAALEPVVRKVLTHTTVDKPVSLHIPRVTEYWYEIPESCKGPSDEVKGIFSSFDVKCRVDDQIGVASADVKGHGLLLNKYNIENNHVDKTSMVTFTFATRVVGVHDIDLRFAEALTMNTGTKRIQVTVTDI